MDRVFFALHLTAKQAKGGLSGLARRLGKREQTLINKLNPMDDVHQPNIGELVAIVDDTDDTAPIEALCALFGGRFVTRCGDRVGGLMQAVLQADTEHGDVARAIHQALADDGEIDARERAAIMREISEARRALTILENELMAGGAVVRLESRDGQDAG